MIVGIVGGIGAGKSTVTRLCTELGAEAVDADALAHEALEAPPVREVLREWLGARAFAPTGKVDRRSVANLVFSDPEKLKMLEALLHPYVLARIEARVRDHERTPGRVLVLDVPLLLESPLRARCDAVIYVDASPRTRQDRVAARGWGERELERREAQQTPDAVKRRAATAVIDNSGSLEATRRQVTALYSDWTKKHAT